MQNKTFESIESRAEDYYDEEEYEEEEDDNEKQKRKGPKLTLLNNAVYFDEAFEPTPQKKHFSNNRTQIPNLRVSIEMANLMQSDREKTSPYAYAQK